MSRRGALLRLARRILQSVLAQITQQMNLVEQLAQMVVGAYMSRVQASWQGDDAVGFIDEVNNRLIPEFRNLGIALATIPTNLERAAEIIETADNEARGMADNLADVFNAIY